jgi:hypothetical protein
MGVKREFSVLVGLVAINYGEEQEGVYKETEAVGLAW